MHTFTHIFKHSLQDIIPVVPFLFCAFLLIELFEHKFSPKAKKRLEKSTKAGPLIGSFLGILPQCGFSVLATNLYITRIISLGTLISVYLTTSDEMLAILISNQAPLSVIIKILITKFVIGLIAGFIIDIFIRRHKKPKDFKICEEEECHCHQENLLLSSMTHTLKTLLFIFIVTFLLNTITEIYGLDFLEKIFFKDSLLSIPLASLVGLIPNCAGSILLTELYINNAISFASLIAGVSASSGLGLLILFKNNKNFKENLFILALIYFISVASGIIIHILGLF